MTLIVSVISKQTIWMAADRRLSYGGSRPPKDDARKIMHLETRDGLAILGYAGLGRTANGTEPSEWMSRVLRGRNLPLIDSLFELTRAAKEQIPRHIQKFPKEVLPRHTIMAPSFLNGDNRFYAIDLVLEPGRQEPTCKLINLAKNPRVALAGSGAAFLELDLNWKRKLLRLVNACDLQKISPAAVANCLAELNYQAHVNTPDQTVGPRCIVVWRHRKDGIFQGGGSHEFYNGTTKELIQEGLPYITMGIDLQALGNLFMEEGQRWASQKDRKFDPDDQITKKFNKLPSGPDEKLR